MMKKFMLTLTLTHSIITSVSAIAGEQVIRLKSPWDGNGQYAVQMLKLSLAHVDKKYKLEMVDGKDDTQARNIEDVENGSLDIMWAATDAEMESKLLPVRIPLYKGLLGHRVFIIRKGEQERFDNVRSLEDLKKFKFGQGKTWADTKILESNGLTVVKSVKYNGLFHMLDGGRFDAFPRGVQEPWQELLNNAQLPLAVENKILLVYKMPFYLFTRKENKTFAADLEQGFNRAITDGSFDQIFYSSPIVKAVAENAGMENRVIITINNPNLTKETPLDRPELWLDIAEFKKHMSATHD